MDKWVKIILGIILIIVFIIVIVKIHSTLVHVCRKICLDDVIDFDELDKHVKRMFIVRRALASGRWPIATTNFSHWGVLCETFDRKLYIIQIQMNNITEIKKARRTRDPLFVKSYGEEKSWVICEEYDSYHQTLKEMLIFTNNMYKYRKFNFFGYNCQRATIDMVNHFSTSEYNETYSRSNKMDVISEVLNEFVNYKHYKL